jgi:pimeloyl-ACP methyl ester carboxylesterase
LLQLDNDLPDFRIFPVSRGGDRSETMIACVNGSEGRRWHEEPALLNAISRKGYAIVVIDPRGVGRIQPSLAVAGRDYCDPICGVEENIAYNAFLVGRSLMAMRVADVVVAVQRLIDPARPRKLILMGRRDAALIACLAAAIEPAIDRVAVEDLLPSFRLLFSSEGRPINAASILPGLLKHFGDVDDVLAQISPRKVLVAGPASGQHAGDRGVSVAERRFTEEGKVLLDWLEV